MSDSVDRVFVQALNTVKRIPRTGSARPPASARLKLYGLYKQSMEGDVEGVMRRPVPVSVSAAQGRGSEVDEAEAEKWDAWSAQHGLSRTEAKRRYITTLIEAMHKYASSSREGRELVAELEFVWDQIKSNSVSSASSPGQNQGFLQSAQQVQEPLTSTRPGGEKELDEGDGGNLRMVQPFSSSDAGHESDEDEEGGDNFPEGDEAPFQITTRTRTKTTNPLTSPNPDLKSTSQSAHNLRTQKWRKRIEQTLVKITAEIAALREQLESSQSGNFPPNPNSNSNYRGVGRGVRGRESSNRRRSLWTWMLIFMVTTARHIIVDAFAVGVLLWIWRRSDEKVRDGVRALVRLVWERVEGWRGRVSGRRVGGKG